jgi:hypothetical protein
MHAIISITAGDAVATYYDAMAVHSSNECTFRPEWR